MFGNHLTYHQIGRSRGRQGHAPDLEDPFSCNFQQRKQVSTSDLGVGAPHENPKSVTVPLPRGGIKGTNFAHCWMFYQSPKKWSKLFNDSFTLTEADIENFSTKVTTTVASDGQKISMTQRESNPGFLHSGQASYNQTIKETVRCAITTYGNGAGLIYR